MVDDDRRPERNNGEGRHSRDTWHVGYLKDLDTDRLLSFIRASKFFSRGFISFWWTPHNILLNWTTASLISRQTNT